MKNKNVQPAILILGGGAYQLQGVRTAKRMGFTTVVMDGDPDAPGLAEADIPVTVDFTNVNSAIEVGKKYGVSGVITISTEVGVVPCARVSMALGLKGLDMQTAEAATNKVLMRECLRQAGLSVPRFAGFDDQSLAIAFADDIGYPCIIKPAVGSGSRGVRILTKRKDVYVAFLDAQSESRDGNVIIEEYMPGEEVHVDCLACDGKVTVLGIADKKRTPEPYRSDIRVCYPALLGKETVAEVKRQAIAASKAIGISNGASHTELLVDGKSVRVVEIAARGAGFNVFTKMLKLISGIDPVEAVINMAMGKHPEISPTQQRASILSFFTVKPGRLKRVIGLERANKIEGVVELVVTVQPGERINEYRSGSDRIGYVIVHADTREEVEQIERNVLETIRFEVDTCE